MSRFGRDSANAAGCEFDPHTTKWNIHLSLLPFLRSRWCPGKPRRWVLPLSTQCLQNWAQSGKTECLNTRYPLPTLLCWGYSVKLKKMKILNISFSRLEIDPTTCRVYNHTFWPCDTTGLWFPNDEKELNYFFIVRIFFVLRNIFKYFCFFAVRLLNCEKLKQI